MRRLDQYRRLITEVVRLRPEPRSLELVLLDTKQLEVYLLDFVIFNLSGQLPVNTLRRVNDSDKRLRNEVEAASERSEE